MNTWYFPGYSTGKKTYEIIWWFEGRSAGPMASHPGIYRYGMQFDQVLPKEALNQVLSIYQDLK